MERTTDHSCEAKLTAVKLYFEFHVCYRYCAHFRSIMAAVNKVLINMFTASVDFFTRLCETNTR